MTFDCNCCHKTRSIKVAAKTFTRTRERSYTICKECVNERAKSTIRASKLKRMPAELKQWPIAKIEMEIYWLESKLDLLRAERAKRKPMRAPA